LAEREEVGREHLDEFKPGFHDRLARNWPEPREQLHAGGWAATRRLVKELAIGPADSVLDVCCGEGGSAVWLARNIGARLVGIDILQAAVESARRRAAREGVLASCAFLRANLFSLPFRDESFDVVFGQDADGFAHGQRIVAFRECFRVLRPGGRFQVQHWIPWLDAPPAVTERFDQVQVEVGYPSHADVHAEAYLQAMRAASFHDVRAIDRSKMYRKHMLAIAERARARQARVDAWTATWLELAERHPFGVVLAGRKAG
jgi:SAM-dependent methyltransferase